MSDSWLHTIEKRFHLVIHTPWLVKPYSDLCHHVQCLPPCGAKEARCHFGWEQEERWPLRCSLDRPTASRYRKCIKCHFSLATLVSQFKFHDPRQGVKNCHKRGFFAKGQRGTLKCVKATVVISVANNNNDSGGNNCLDRAQGTRDWINC